MENVIFHSTCTGTRDGVDTRLPKDLTVACNDKQELACDSCGATDETNVDNGVRYCKPCWLDANYPMPLVCDSCGGLSDLTEFTGLDGQVYHACATCWVDIQDSREELETECLCDDCGLCIATQTFNHLDGRSFQLCSECFGFADHEDEYGKSTLQVYDETIPTNEPDIQIV